MRICTLASGSSGNCIYVGTANSHLLIDAGISCRRINTALQEKIGITGHELDGIIITHEHSDHIQGLEVFTKRFRTPVYTTEGTWKEIYGKLSSLEAELYCPVQKDQSLHINSFSLDAFGISHDAADPIGLVLSNGNKRLGVATDLGVLNSKIINALKNCDALILEANYDQAMLHGGSYPSFLKKRISGSLGHLSNDEAGQGLIELISEKTKTVILAHLSQENNLPFLAKKTIENIFKENKLNTPFNLKVAPRSQPGACINI